jgi:hypothetical protein
MTKQTRPRAIFRTKPTVIAYRSVKWRRVGRLNPTTKGAVANLLVAPTVLVRLAWRYILL